MSVKIELTPSELLAQATEMTSLMQSYESLFNSVTNELNSINANWSKNLAHNFAGKITSAQKTFGEMIEYLSKGSEIARTSAGTYESVDKQLATLFGGQGSQGGGGGGSRGATTGISVDSLLENKMFKELVKEAGLEETFNDIKEAQGILDAVYSGDNDKLNDIAFKKIKEYLKQYAEDGVEGSIVLDTCINSLKAITGEIKKYIDNPSMRNGAEFAWNFTGGALGKALVDFGYNFWNKVPVVNTLVNQTLDQYGGGVEGLSNLTNETMNTIMGDDWTSYYKENGGYFNGVYNGCVETINYIKDNGLSGVTDIAKGFGDGIAQFGKGTYDYIKSAYDSVAEYCHDFGVGKTVETLSQPIIDSLNTFLSDKLKSFNPFK